MKLIAALILISFIYGLARLMFGLVKELAEFAIEAWRDVETGQ